MSLIQMNHLTKNYGKVRAVKELNLCVEEGEFFGFIGPNGAGKSTTIRTLLGLIAPTAGQATIFGYDIVTDRDKILARTGYLPSEVTFYSGMKVKDMFKLSADLRKQNCEKEAKLLCERLELDMDKKIEELSFGNRKKVGIVCALAHDPELLILDEPTSGLDPLMQKEFFNILQEKHQKGTTIFLSSHVLSEIQRYCTRAAIIREGRIIACDTVEALSKTSVKKVQVQGQVDLSALQGVRDQKEQAEGMSFLYSGEIKTLLQTLAHENVWDVSIADPDLEEVFLHYYQKQEQEGASI